jgi:hypothetical protein
MGAPVHRIEVGDLPDGEGSAYLLEQSWEEPKQDKVFAKTIFEGDQHRGMGFTKIFHEPCGRNFDAIQMSANKRVLVCVRCLLRLTVPVTVTTVTDFKEYISRT